MLYPSRVTFQRPTTQAFSGTGYHGSWAKHRQLYPSFKGHFGPGVYFALVPDEAACYGEYVHTAAIVLDSPWRIEADFDSDLAMELDLDNPCLEAVMTLPGGPELIDDMISRPNEIPKFDHRLQEILVGLGYDGIVAKYNCGCHEIVVFENAGFTIESVMVVEL